MFDLAKPTFVILDAYDVFDVVYRGAVFSQDSRETIFSVLQLFVLVLFFSFET